MSTVRWWVKRINSGESDVHKIRSFKELSTETSWKEKSFVSERLLYWSVKLCTPIICCSSPWKSSWYYIRRVIPRNNSRTFIYLASLYFGGEGELCGIISMMSYFYRNTTHVPLRMLVVYISLKLLIFQN